MLARTETDLTIAEHWLAQFERALREGDNAPLKTRYFMPTVTGGMCCR
jgi:hypothetical protein